MKKYVITVDGDIHFQTDDLGMFLEELESMSMLKSTLNKLLEGKPYKLDLGTQ